LYRRFSLCALIIVILLLHRLSRVIPLAYLLYETCIQRILYIYIFIHTDILLLLWCSILHAAASVTNIYVYDVSRFSQWNGVIFLRFTYYYFYRDEHDINYHSPLSKQFDLILNVNIDVRVGVQYVRYYTYIGTLLYGA